MQDKIIVKGARANNLKNIDVTIPVPASPLWRLIPFTPRDSVGMWNP